MDRPVKRLLVVEDDDVARQSIVELIGDGDVETTTVASGEEALARLQSERFDCMVLDLGLPDMTGFELITRVKSEIGLRKLPTIVYTGKELTRREEAELRRLAESVVIKDAGSPERLLDETALFLHRVTARLPEGKRRMLEQLHRTDPDAHRPQGADRGRRRPQHLRADHLARAQRDAGALRRERPGRHRAAAGGRRTSTSS